jgi:hypothetical protein
MGAWEDDYREYHQGMHWKAAMMQFAIQFGDRHGSQRMARRRIPHHSGSHAIPALTAFFSQPARSVLSPPVVGEMPACLDGLANARVDGRDDIGGVNHSPNPKRERKEMT